jgi:hypothetical protein
MAALFCIIKTKENMSRNIELDSIHFSWLLQQHNSDYIHLSIGLVYVVTAGKDVGGGQDAKLAG